MTTYEDFPRASAEPRGCGDERTPGGCYAECGVSKHGSPLEAFLVDPPLPLPEGLDIINKPMLWQDRDGTHHLLIWIGEEHYPYCPDYIEETRRLGASRKINPQLDLTLLNAKSRMILVHPKAINTLWEKMYPPYDTCKKHIEGHDGEFPPTILSPKEGPCLFKLYDLLPDEAAEERLTTKLEGPITCLRRIGSTIYLYHPSYEHVPSDALQPGIFAMLPLHSFALITNEDGSVNETAKKKLQEANLNFYESDK